MSNTIQRIKNATRRFRDTIAIQRQLSIAKAKGLFGHKRTKESHRLAKHHVTDCGNPACFVCGNPRKTHKDKLTVQEKRLYQDVDTVRDVKSNGTDPNKSE